MANWIELIFPNRVSLFSQRKLHRPVTPNIINYSMAAWTIINYSTTTWTIINYPITTGTITNYSMARLNLLHYSMSSWNIICSTVKWNIINYSMAVWNIIIYSTIKWSIINYSTATWNIIIRKQYEKTFAETNGNSELKIVSVVHVWCKCSLRFNFSPLGREERSWCASPWNGIYLKMSTRR